jgi:hypothetical protein
MSNKSKTNRKPTARKSLKGLWHHKGAPPKSVRWPKGPFDYERLFAMNMDPKGKDQRKSCELTLRTKVAKELINPSPTKKNPNPVANPNGTLYQLPSKKQPHGKVGRPIDIFCLKADFDRATMALKAGNTAKTIRVKAPPVAVATVVPVTTATAAIPAPTDAQPANPRPLVQVTFTKNGPVVTPIGPKVG